MTELQVRIFFKLTLQN